MKKGYFRIIAGFIFVIFVLSIGSEYAKSLPKWLDYLCIPFHNILSISVAIFISYFLTQKKNDQRKIADTSLMVIERIFSVLNDDRLHTIKIDEDITFVRITQKRIDNELKVLSNNLKNEELVNKVKYLQDQFNAYWELVSNHISDIKHLQNSQMDLLNFITNIEGKLSELMFDIYKK